MNGLDSRWVGAGVALVADKVDFTSRSGTNIKGAQRIAVGPAVALQIPMSIGKVYVQPYVMGSVGFNLSGFGFGNKSPDGFVTVFEGGVKGGYDFGTAVNVFASLAYRYTGQKPDFAGNAPALKKTSVALSAILVF